MKRLLASFITAGAILPLLWFNIIPWAGEYCPKDASGKTVEYTVQRPNGFGEIVTLVFGGSSQQQLCKMVEDFPA